jgi:CRP-like cAMP-binding protein
MSDFSFFPNFVESPSAMKQWSAICAEGRFGLPLRFDDRSIIFSRGDVADAVYFLHSGAVEILHDSNDGRAVLVKILVAPCLFGSIEQLGGSPHYLETVRVLGEATMVRVGGRAFMDQLRTDVRLSNECLVDVGTAFCVAAQLEPARLFGLESQLAAVLLAYGDAVGNKTPLGAIRLRVARTQADLAAAIGASERSITRCLADWKKSAIIDKRAGKYFLLEVDRLIDIAGPLQSGIVHRLRSE